MTQQTRRTQTLAGIKVAGWQKQSLIDYPGKIASVIFLAGCNMRCAYCHNRQIWSAEENRLPLKPIYQALEQRRAWLDAVVVSGGEPTLFPSLIPLLRALRKLGLLIKLDTNGTQPAVVRAVVNDGLVDYVALDVKAPADKHVILTGMPIDSVLETVRFLKQQKKIPYMLRTTLSPCLDVNDLINIGQKIVDGAPLWQIQQCRIEGAYRAQEIEKMVAKVENYAQHIVVTGI